MQISKSMEIAEKALDFRALRQKLIAGNLANVNTPFYKSRDISFESMLAREADSLHHKKHAPLIKTHPDHLDPVSLNTSNQGDVFFRGTHPTKNDGSNVDLDVESTEMSKNSMMYNAIINAKKKNTMIFKSVLEASAKTQ